MKNIKTTLIAEGIDIEKLSKFIEHWRKIKDLPCEDIKINRIKDKIFKIELYYPLDIFDKSVTQFLTVLFGELSFVVNFGKIKFVDLDLPDEVYKWFKGPKFGVDEIRKRFSVDKYPMLMAIIKPSLGREITSKDIEKKINVVLNNGFHGIKDDEMQGNLVYSPLKDRIKFARKYKKYAPSLNLDSVEEYKRLIGTKDGKNIGMVIINASTLGFPMLYEIRKITNVPILSHVALQGIYAQSMSPSLFAKLHRLFGCDAFINPIGEVGYFKVNREEEKEMAIEFTKDLPIKKTLPLFAGGARLNNLLEIIQPYEKMKIPFGVVFGSLIFSYPSPPSEMCRKVINALNSR